MLHTLIGKTDKELGQVANICDKCEDVPFG